MSLIEIVNISLIFDQPHVEEFINLKPWQNILVNKFFLSILDTNVKKYTKMEKKSSEIL